MGVTYQTVIWTRQKKIYDIVLWGFILLYLVVFGVMQLQWYPDITAETIVIRATGSLAFLLLHIILVIGPLCRLNPRFLPLLYNRRHLGVSMFLIALIHGIFNIIQFHALGNVSPLLSVFTSNTHYDSLSQFPFQTLGFLGLLILFFMAVSSHDFWLHNLSPRLWKSLHMMVYVAYFLIVMHVMLGTFQVENSQVGVLMLAVGMFTILFLHLTTAFVEVKRNKIKPQIMDGFVAVCDVKDIEENRAKVILIEGENIAVFKYNGKLSAINNICKHQNGPLGEGKIVDGCITCPWHGYQYLPENGCSPPPFTEKVSTYNVKLVGTKVYVHPKPHPEGTAVAPILLN
ncbi:MAG: ferric reductase-like transmembrane domain-containing protein [Chitinophagales bacterium]